MYDLIIIGGGPAGLSAAIYALRARMNIILIEKMAVGGQIALSDNIENYPGFPSLSGYELMTKFEEHAKGLGLTIVYDEIKEITDNVDYKTLKGAENNYETRSIIVAVGASPKRLGIPGELEYTGKGVSYCATCDGPFFRDQDIAVIGGGDTAVKEAHYLSKLVKSVVLIHRRKELRAEKIIQERLNHANNVSLKLEHIPISINGDKGVESITIENVKTKERNTIPVKGVFIFVGIKPQTSFLHNVDKDELGFIKADPYTLMTSMPGVFCAGDSHSKKLLQVATAVGEGALAATSAEEFVCDIC
ncbi:MAG: thioredoxin-disulfide reductase [Candidatus Acididesulfobacter guangdongensis]|uniref:Thioredoxin reductase n=1 Tax=Acididesulfobacter guangdongensis TaxID=2597225 RepID=A0A519BG88_ACIG2|nr:MAG: thioredoxin-disulfide reductase [Candidatus Acididesulfobacter guangdongensis]